MNEQESREVFVLPASLQQRRYFAFAEAYPESRVWNVAARWSLRGPLRTDLLERALNAVCKRHESLRTCLGEENGEVIQKVVSEFKISVPVHDLRHLAPEARTADAERKASEEAKEPFDLRKWPLVRFQLLRLEDEHHVLLVTAHHIVADGWSIGIISRDMGAYYDALLNDKDANLTELPVQFADFAIWQKESLEGGAFASQLTFWKKDLRGFVPLRLAGDLSTGRAGEETWNGTIVSQLLPRSLTDTLAQSSQRQGATLFSTALAALYVVMHGVSGRKDLSIGTQVAGRNRVEIENAIGVFNNGLVLRSHLDRESSFASFVASVADTVIQATANQDLPYESVMQSVFGDAELGKRRLYYVNFIYQRSFIQNIKFADVQLTDLPSRSPGAPYDLNFFMVERPEGWRLSLEYNTDRYSSAFAQGVLASFAATLKEVASEFDVRISQLESLRSVEENHSTEKLGEPEECLLFPASMGQQRYWVLDQLGQSSASFKMPIRWRLNGQVEADILESAFNELIRRNEIMRTTLIEVDGQPMQRVVPALSVAIPRFDLRHLSEKDKQAEVERIADGVGEGQFNMSRLPLIHAALVRLENEEYIFCVTVHPIVCDGLAVGLLAKELFDIYNAYVRKDPHGLMQPELQYGDYALWQRDFVQSPAMQEQVQYWLSRLKNYEPFEIMPDRPRPALQTTNGAFLSLQLPKTLTNELQTISKQQGNSFFITVFAAFLTLLYRYTGQADISVGTEVSGRNQTEHEQVIGLFLNTIVLRSDLSGNPRFTELLQRVQDVVTQAIGNQDVPFQKVVESVNPQRDPSRKPLFQINFMLQRSTVANRDYESFSLIDIPSKPLGALFDLNWLMVERVDGWRVAIQYNTDLFESQTVERMLAHFNKLLEGVAQNPHLQLSEFEILTDEEQTLLQQWNSTDCELLHETVPELFAAQLAETPDSIAVECGKGHLTFAELDRRANQLAHHLRKRGVVPDVKVGLCVERSLNMTVALLAILKAGGTYVPLDPDYPVERLQFMALDSRISLLITQTKFLGLLPTNSVRTLCVDSEQSAIAKESSSNPVTELKGDSIAYVIYTSGSTGGPKGVMVPHRALANLLRSTKNEPGIGRSDVLVAITTISFDIAALEIFLPLTSGARLVLASREEVQDGRRLLDLLKRVNATVMQGTPASWQILLDAGWNGDPKLKILCGGEALSSALATRLVKTRCELWNLYGPTETTVWSSIAKISDISEPVYIGRPIANTRLYVLDGARRLVTIGAPGELYIAGAGVAAGYLEKPELSEERFVANPFSTDTRSRLYRTGDLVRWRHNGQLEFLSRVDGQVKIRGFRVEAGEIETTLLQHPDVREAAILAVPDFSGTLSLIAYVITYAPLSADRQPFVESLRVHLRKTLPDYMQPSALVFLESMPRTENGKIDRRALLERAGERETVSSRDAAPANAIEEKLAVMWETILGVRHVSTNANFFDLGGHSLLAAKLMTRVEQEFGKKIPLAVLFQSPTVQQLSRVLIGEPESAVVPGVVAIQSQGDEAPFFCVNGWSEMRRLAIELGMDRPFLALNIPDAEALKQPYKTEEIAAHLITTMKTIQPDGPYFLGGWCRAGVIAYEMARQLQRSREEVRVVVLFESWSPTHLSRFPKWKARRARISLELWRLKVHLRKVLHMGVSQSLAYTREHMGNLRERFLRVARHSLYNFQTPPAHPSVQRPHSKDEVMDLAVTSYEPGFYDGNVILFRANEYQTWKYWDPTLGWGDYLPKLEIHEVPGKHESAAFFTGPYAVSVAREMRVAMKETSGPTPSTKASSAAAGTAVSC